VEKLTPAYGFLKASQTKGVEPAFAARKPTYNALVKPFIVGGIHTPNHRWVVSAALTKLNELWPDPRYVKRIEQWLLEHIDLDPMANTPKKYRGYTLVDRVLITMAKGLKKPEDLTRCAKTEHDHVLRAPQWRGGHRGIESTRQRHHWHAGSYYYSDRYLALLTKTGNTPPCAA